MALSVRAKEMARLMAIEGLSAEDAYIRAGYKGQPHSATNITRKDAFRRYRDSLQQEVTNASLAAKVRTYEEILNEVNRLIDDDEISHRNKLTALKLLGSAKTIAAWKDIQEVQLNEQAQRVLGSRANRD